MNCAEAQELITGLVDNELAAPERTSIEAHLKNCPRCRFSYEREMALKREVRITGAAAS